MKSLCTALLLAVPTAAFAADSQTSVLDVQNMTCPTCSITIRKALEKVPGVSSAKVDYNHKTVVVVYDPHKATAQQLVSATGNAGFPAKLHGGGAR
ncbi:cation transporter [soil metagenome]